MLQLQPQMLDITISFFDVWGSDEVSGIKHLLHSCKDVHNKGEKKKEREKKRKTIDYIP